MSFLDTLKNNTLLHVVIIFVVIYVLTKYKGSAGPVEPMENTKANAKVNTTLVPEYPEAADFTKNNPVSKILKDRSFLEVGHNIGTVTSVQSNKIPYLDIRSLPPIVKKQVSPFMRSSYEESPGQKRKYFEIGI